MTLRIGLLSTANINDMLIGGARAASDVAEVTAVASRDSGRARDYAAEKGIARSHGSYEELLADPEVDAVYISLPNGMHADWSIRALQAGKHVLCEKPLSRRPADVERAFDAADEAGRVLMEAFMWRYTPQTDKLLELIPRVGTLRLVRAAFSFPEREPGDVRLNKDLDGGALMDVGCYCVSAARLIAGAPEAYAAREIVGPGGVDLLFTGSMHHVGHVLSHFDCGMTTAPRDELEVVGTDASLFLDDPWHNREPAIELRGADGSVERIELDPVDPYGCELRELAAIVAGERPQRFGRDDAVEQSRAISRLYEAAAS